MLGHGRSQVALEVRTSFFYRQCVVSSSFPDVADAAERAYLFTSHFLPYWIPLASLLDSLLHEEHPSPQHFGASFPRVEL
jgi:hypothetical protein